VRLRYLCAILSLRWLPLRRLCDGLHRRFRILYVNRCDAKSAMARCMNLAISAHRRPVIIPNAADRPFARRPLGRHTLPALHYCHRRLEKRMPTRLDAWKLLCEFTESESLRKHMLAVEACVRAYARKQGADEETWGLAALLHDFDYERWPNNAHSPDKEHPAEGAKILRERGYSEEIVRAILSHADYSGVARQSPLEHTLFACDELAGFLSACSYVRPSKSILDLEVDSVKRRLKDKAFAKGVSRDDVRKGAEELGIPLEEHIGFCISAMREEADALGLRGNIGAQAAQSGS
jgi:putative nucleotidyltransferase with HDIG domain